jgi:hypothetical protein
VWSWVIGSGGFGCDLGFGVVLDLGCVGFGHALELPGAVLELPVVVGLQ